MRNLRNYEAVAPPGLEPGRPFGPKILNRWGRFSGGSTGLFCEVSCTCPGGLQGPSLSPSLSPAASGGVLFGGPTEAILVATRAGSRP